ncbi:MAG: hypothetical protein QM651_02145 [Rhodoblastus sp.]
MRKFVFVLALGCATGAAAAEWDQFRNAAFGAADGKGPVCFSRVYDAQHLAANKAQRIRDVAIRLAMRTENNETYLDHSLVTHLVGSKQKYWSGGQCSGFAGLVAHCYVEGDGGGVDLTLDSDGKTLTARFDRFNIWRPQDAADETTMTFDKSPADKVAKLTKAPMSACRETGE